MLLVHKLTYTCIACTTHNKHTHTHCTIVHIVRVRWTCVDADAIYYVRCTFNSNATSTTNNNNERNEINTNTGGGGSNSSNNRFVFAFVRSFVRSLCFGQRGNVIRVFFSLLLCFCATNCFLWILIGIFIFINLLRSSALSSIAKNKSRTCKIEMEIHVHNHKFSSRIHFWDEDVYLYVRIVDCSVYKESNQAFVC